MKHRLFVPEQVVGRVKLHDVAPVHDHDPAAVQDGLEPVGDRKDGAVAELLPDGASSSPSLSSLLPSSLSLSSSLSSLLP